MTRLYNWVFRIDWSDMTRHEYDYDRYVDTLMLAIRKGWLK